MIMFSFLDEVGKGIGSVFGAATGLIGGMSYEIIAKSLEISTNMVEQAVKSGCETFEEIRKYADENS